MATIRPRKNKDGSTSFHVMVRMTGYPTSTKTFSTRRLAQRWATKTEASMIEGRHFKEAAAGRRTLGEAIDRYMQEAVPKKRGGGAMHTICLRWWKAKLGGLRLSDVTADVLTAQRTKLANEKYRRARPGARRSELPKGQEPPTYTRSPATVNRYMECLSHVFTVARKEWRWNLMGNPCSDISKLHVPKKGRKHYIDEERARLLAETAKEPQLHVICHLSLATAARAG